MINKYLKYTWLLACFLLIFSIIFCLQKKQLEKLVYEDNFDFYQQEKALATKVKLQNKIPDFGFSNLIGDWTYLQFIQYFGDGEARDITGYSLIPEYFSAMLEQDPYFVKAYLNLSAVSRFLLAIKFPSSSPRLLAQFAAIL